MRPSINYLKQGWQLVLTIINRFFTDGCPGRAAALSYTTLLSLVPLMAVTFAVLSAFPVFHGLGDKIQTFIFANFVADSAQVVQKHLQGFVQQTSRLSAPGLLFLLGTAVLLMFTMEQAFNAVWHVAKRRRLVSAFLLYWGVLTLTPILLGVAFAMSSYLDYLPLFSGSTEIAGLKQAVLNYLPYLLTFVAFTIFYGAIPNCFVPPKNAFIGAVVSTILFELAKFGFSFYVSSFPTYHLLYGALATIPIFLVWMYVSWMIILFGAIVSHELTVRQGK